MKNIILESVRKKLEKENRHRQKLFSQLRSNLPSIIEILSGYPLEKAVLFGSITDSDKFREHSDIDIGVIGLPAKDFFKLYSSLSERIPWQIDLVDLDEDPEFKTMILAKGEIIYDRRNHHKNTDR